MEWKSFCVFFTQKIEMKAGNTFIEKPKLLLQNNINFNKN
jgi:hypothetical protein